MFATTRPTLPAHARLAAVVGVLAILLAGIAAALAPPARAADVNQVELASSGNLRADVMWASTADYAGVFLWPDNKSYSQELNFLDSGNGYVRIQARHSGKCLMRDWRQNAAANGTQIIQYGYCGAGYANSEWKQVTAPQPPCPSNRCFSNGYVLLKNRATGRCLDIANGAGGTAPAQARLQEWDCVTSASAWNYQNQAWRVTTASSVPPPVIR